MRGKYDLNQNLLGLCQLFLLAALVHGGRRNARCNWIFFIPIFILYTYSVFFCASDSPPADFSFIMSFMAVIPTAFDYILLRNRQPELRKIGQKKATSEMSFTERLIWAASLLLNMRGVGWTHEPTNHIPPRPTASRGKFIASQVLWIMFYNNLLDIALIHIQGNPCFMPGGPSFAAFGWWWRMTALVYIVLLYCTMSATYATGSIVGVATGLYEPKDFPHMFGSVLDAYTLRNCWGYVLTMPSFSRPHKIGQSRLAPDPSQDAHQQLKFPCGCFPPPQKHIHDILQTFHVISHFWTHAHYRRLYSPPEFLSRNIHTIFPSPSGWHHLRRRGHCSRLAPGI
jgi:hypothetical protein